MTSDFDASGQQGRYDFFMAYRSGSAYLEDREGLIARLERVTEWDWYHDGADDEVPSIWMRTPDGSYLPLNVSRTPVGDGRSCAQDVWRLVRTDNGDDLLDGLMTEYAPENPWLPGGL